MRLQTYIAHAGVSSRRSAEALIRSGKVRVNGTVVFERGFAVNPARDTVELDGIALAAAKKEYYVMNKPKGVTSTVKDAHASRTVIECMPQGLGRLYPVGRLDRETTGVLVVTNDGGLVFRLTHPRFEVKKVYHATVEGTVSSGGLRRFARGIDLDDGPTSPCRIKVLSKGADKTAYEIEIHEGKKRQIRRMFDAIGHRVIDLKRTSFAGISLGRMREGEVRKLSAGEVAALMAEGARCARGGPHAAR